MLQKHTLLPLTVTGVFIKQHQTWRLYLFCNLLEIVRRSITRQAVNTGELRFAEEIPDRVALEDELLSFERQTTASGRSTFSARSGKHDDLILSVAIGLWWAMRDEASGPTSSPITGFY